MASGKSTLAHGLAAAARRAGHPAASIELDTLYQMLERDTWGSLEIWSSARLAAAALATHLWESGIELVVVEGDLQPGAERDQLLERVEVTEVHAVTLRAAPEEALRRAQADPTRVLSKREDVLRRAHARFRAAFDLAQHADVVIETDAISAADLVAQLYERVFGAAGPATL
jgi:adenylylsulfate kinase-like enzyme